ncbi:MAG: tripartite tricarboxylate transporter substrate binding protein, partial [Burkholderiaceae bacterium]
VCSVQPAAAQGAPGGYPNKPIRLVIPFAPGGPTDLFARLFAERLTAVSGQQVVVENRAGAAGNIAYASVAKSPPDGYTLLLGTTGLATNPLIYRSLPYEAARDFQPVALLAMAPLVLLVPQGSSDTVASVVAHLKANPGKLSYPSGGSGTSTHLAAEMFKLKAGVDAIHVPYRGSGPAFLDTLAGRHAFMFDTIGASRPHVAAGKLNLVAVAGAKRAPAAPGVPTFAELGIEGVQAFTWNMLLVPSATPRAVVESLNRLANAAVSNTGLATRTGELAIDLIVDSTPESAAAFLASETRRWTDVVKASGIKVDE